MPGDVAVADQKELNMGDVVIVESVRSPFGKRNGGLSAMHSIDLLGAVQRALIERSGIDPAEVGQVVGGCVGQVGMQTMNITRNAWLAAGLPLEVAATTVDAQCGSSQQAMNLAYGLVAAGVVDSAVACGVESMSGVPMGASIPKDPNVGKPVNRAYREHYEWTSQFDGAERIATQWGITREMAEEFAKTSQDRAAKAQANGNFEMQLVPIDAPVPGDTDGARHTVAADEGPRETTLEGLAKLKPNMGEGGVHTAGTSSQISDGASAVLMMTAEKATALGLRARARIVDSCLIGSDPVLMLTGPIGATQTLLARTGLAIDDLDVIEINEAFASVVLAWQQETGADMSKVNPNGGAIALGHPLGATGTGLVTKAVHELERSGGSKALITMCCGGGLGTGTILERI
jgi:acetyl-CoA C-acetyltransferase